jgi:FtsP/CotA-like multicopper oxidase with cupredoxin domain
LEARVGEVVRLWLTNTANTRVFNLSVPGAQMKLVGGDSGRVEHQEFIESVVLAPSERAIVDVLVDRPGALHLEHHTPDRVYRLATMSVSEHRAGSSSAEAFEVLGQASELAAEREQLDRWLAAAPDKVLALVAQMDDPAAMPEGAGPVTYACPMHPEVTSEEPGRCPECGMKLLATAAPAVTYACPMHPEVTSTEPGRCPKCGMKLLATQAPVATTYACPMHPEVTSTEPGRCPKCGMKLLATAAPAITYACPMHPEVTSDQPGHCPKCGMKLLAAESIPKPAAAHDPATMEHHGGHAADHHHGEGEAHEHGSAEGIEWEDDMVEVNRLTTTATMHWRFLDRTTGADSPAIDWHFTVGDRVKIRLVNEMESDHPMHHPFHLHGAGRFLVLSRDGVVEPNLVWKDTVLVRTGQVVDILFDVSNPGLWMAHCHIAEHMQSGMMFSFNVARAQAVAT